MLNFLTEFYSILIAFITFTSSSLCAAIVSAISVNLYPTNVRAMATCFIYMFGRVGGLAGGNLIGFFVENHCNSIFYTFGVLSLGKAFISISFKILFTIEHIKFEFISVCAFVFLLIRKETTNPDKEIQGNECTL